MQSVLEPNKYLEAVSDHKIENKKLTTHTVECNPL